MVLDPVMVAKSGDALLAPDAVDALREQLLPLAEVVTPNAPEAEVLSGLPVAGEDDILAAAEAIHALGARHVLIKGGHLAGDEVVDYLYSGKGLKRFSGPRVDTRHTHGTGCTYASAVCAYLARGAGVQGAVRHARRYVQGAIEHAPGLGGGHGPLHHGWNLHEAQ